MTKRLAAALLLIVVAVPMYADFNRIARAIDRQDGVKRIWIPFLSVARFLVWGVHPKGVHDFQLATFEGASRLDPRKLQTMMEREVGEGFMPLVQVWSKKKSEYSFIYVRPKGERMELIILAHDNSDTVLVRVDVNAEILARELSEPRNVRRVATR